jgi:GAF domain-containing protein
MTVSVYRGEGEFESLIKDVFVQTGAGRVTLRLPAETEIFPVYVEVRDAGVRATGDYAADPNTGTFRYLESELQPLVQSDTRTATDTPPTVLIEKYGVGAQILAPIVVDGALGGIISVHHVGGAREWTPEEIAVATDAASAVANTLRTS